MEWIRNLLGVDKLLSRRNEQLVRQKKQDAYFAKHVERCPVDISLFLLLSREKNRQHTEEYKNASTTACLGLLEKHIEIIKKDQDEIDEMIESGDLCCQLRKHLSAKNENKINLET